MFQAYRRLAIAVLILLLASCARFEPQTPSPDLGLSPTISIQTLQHVTVSATILTDEAASAIYGVNLGDVGLQAIWLRVDNRSRHGYWLLVPALDPQYFAPDEAAVLFHAKFSATDELRITKHFRNLAIPLKTSAGEINEGYILAPRHEGGRYLPVSLYGTHQILEYGFAIPLPDGEFDFEGLDPAVIYAGKEQPNLTLTQLRHEIAQLPCCTGNKDGEQRGDPLNVILIGNRGEMLASLARGGWSFTHRIDFNTVRRLIGAAISGGSYPVAPVSPLYLMGRPQDLALQRARNNILQRNHIRLWLAPFKFEGKSVWVGQVSRDITIKPTLLSSNLMTHVIDPNIDESREHLLQSLLVAGVVESFAFVAGSPPATPENPYTNLTDDPYYTDGLRLMAKVTGTHTTPPSKTEFFEWKTSVDPGEHKQLDR